MTPLPIETAEHDVPASTPRVEWAFPFPGLDEPARSRSGGDVLIDAGFVTVARDHRICWVSHSFVEMTKGPQIFWIGRTVPSFMIALAYLGEDDDVSGRRKALRKAGAATPHRWDVWRILSPRRRWIFQHESESMSDGSSLLVFRDVTDRSMPRSEKW